MFIIYSGQIQDSAFDSKETGNTPGRTGPESCLTLLIFGGIEKKHLRIFLSLEKSFERTQQVCISKRSFEGTKTIIKFKRGGTSL
jgi:hypothetical protein